MTKELTTSPQVGTAFNRGLEIYKENFLSLLVASLLAGLIGGLTCGICSAPLLCGVFAMILSALRGGPAPQIGDVFNGFQKFATAFVSALVLGFACYLVYGLFSVIPVIGWIALIPLGLLVAPMVMSWALLMVTDQDASIGDAILTPLKMLGDKHFWAFGVVVMVAALLGALGALACGIGAIVTIPFAYCVIVAAYEEACSGAVVPRVP